MKCEKELIQLLKERVDWYSEYQGETKAVFSMDRFFVHKFVLIEQVLQKVHTADGPVFTSVNNEFKKLEERVKTDELGKELLSLSKTDIEKLKSIFPNHLFNPYFEIFSGYPMRKRIYENLTAPTYFNRISAEELASMLNGYVDHIKKAMAGPNLKNRIDRFERGSHKNYSSLMGYLDALFETHSKLLVLRIDLGYHQVFSGVGVGSRIIPYGVVKKHRDTLIRNLGGFLKKRLSKDCYVGYALKLEYGAQKAWHYHTLIILNGQRVREDANIAMMIGEYWKSITEGMGLYYNCNANKSRYQTLGIGLIDHRNTALRDGLKKVVTYMTKTDLCAKLVIPDKGRAFSRGEMPKKAKAQGRPRATKSPSSSRSGDGCFRTPHGLSRPSASNVSGFY